MDDIQARAAQVRLLGLDVDGVLTDGRLYYGENEEHFRAFHVRDGLGIRLLAEAGIEVAVISGRRSHSLARRMEPLGVTRIFQGHEDKRGPFQDLLSELALEPEQASFIGDDLQDLPVLLRCGLAATVADAHPEVLARAHWVSSLRGGRGAVRELCELILAAQGRWKGLLDGRYLRRDAAEVD